MSFLLDTNVISEFVKPEPGAAVQKWMRANQSDGLYLSVITVGEIQQGIRRLPRSKKRTRLQEWLNNSILRRYSDFILPIDTAVMLDWGSLTGELLRNGRKLSVMDSLIAATAVHHQLTLVTRNISDFEDLGLVLVNPWE